MSPGSSRDPIDETSQSAASTQGPTAIQAAARDQRDQAQAKPTSASDEQLQREREQRERRGVQRRRTSALTPRSAVATGPAVDRALGQRGVDVDRLGRLEPTGPAPRAAVTSVSRAAVGRGAAGTGSPLVRTPTTS